MKLICWSQVISHQPQSDLPFFATSVYFCNQDGDNVNAEDETSETIYTVHEVPHELNERELSICVQVIL